MSTSKTTSYFYIKLDDMLNLLLLLGPINWNGTYSCSFSFMEWKLNAQIDRDTEEDRIE